MTPMERTSWNKILTLSASFGIPLFSLTAWGIINGTHLVDKVDNMFTRQTEYQISTSNHFDALDRKIDNINHRLDTVTNKQARFGFFTQKIVNGKRIFTPVN